MNEEEDRTRYIFDMTEDEKRALELEITVQGGFRDLDTNNKSHFIGDEVTLDKRKYEYVLDDKHIHLLCGTFSQCTFSFNLTLSRTMEIFHDHKKQLLVHFL